MTVERRIATSRRKSKFLNQETPTSVGLSSMKVVVDWVWNGPWWTPIIGALYLSVLVSIAFGPFIGAMRASKK